MELNILDAQGADMGKITVSDTVFGCEFNEGLVHQVITAYLAASRSGTRAQKTRAQVRGGGAKPWRQKGTGRARAGTIRSPLWRGGGKVFAAMPADYSQKVNRQMYRGALRAILSELKRQERLVVVSELAVMEPKTRMVLAKLTSLKLNEDTLMVTDDVSEALVLATRNLAALEIRGVNDVDPISLIRHQRVLVTAKALQQLTERLI